MYELSQVEQMQAEATGVTMVHPIAAIALIITAFLLLILPRNKALIPFFMLTMLVPSLQRISIGTLAFFLFRILILIGWLRLFIRAEFVFGNKIDKIFGAYVLSHILAVIVLWQSGSGIVRGLSFTLDMFGSYVLMRSLIMDYDDIDRIIKAFAYIVLIIGASMVYEQIIHKNIFAFMGGLPVDTYVREGRYRSQGSFGHPILAGCLGAVMFPLFVYLYVQKHAKILAAIGIGSSLVMVITSSSSSPAFAAMAAIVALLLFPFRGFMKIIRWGLLTGIISLHLVMKAPVWALIERVEVFGGSSSYQRYVLVDQFIRRFNEWWLVGTKSTADWNEYVSTWDVANEYVQTGISGGIFSFILFIVLIIVCFGKIGQGMKSLEQNSDKLFLFWAVGCMLFTHLTAFMGVSYFGQMFLLWTLTLSVIATLSDLSMKHIAALQENTIID
jgi:hypothetical protein